MRFVRCRAILFLGLFFLLTCTISAVTLCTLRSRPIIDRFTGCTGAVFQVVRTVEILIAVFSVPAPIDFGCRRSSTHSFLVWFVVCELFPAGTRSGLNDKEDTCSSDFDQRVLR